MVLKITQPLHWPVNERPQRSLQQTGPLWLVPLRVPANRAIGHLEKGLVVAEGSLETDLEKLPWVAPGPQVEADLGELQALRYIYFTLPPWHTTFLDRAQAVLGSSSPI